MRHIVAVFACFVSCLLLSVPASADMSGQQRAQLAAQGLLGAPAPRLRLKSIDGQDIDLGALYGKKAVYLKFWATWCVPCRQQMPHFEHVQETAGPDLAVIAVNVGFNDSVEAIRTLQKQIKLTMPIVFDDGSIAAAFHVRVTPTHVVIGRDGRVQYMGHLADAAIDDALVSARAASPTDALHAVAAHAPAGLGIGDQLPDSSLKTLDGEHFGLSGGPGKGKMTALVFLATWCESYLETSRPAMSKQCQQMRTQVDALARSHEVRWLGIASGLWTDTDDLAAYQKQYKVAIPLALDEGSNWFRKFRVNDVPTVIVADAHGRIVRRIDANDPTAMENLAAAVKPADIAPATAR